MRPPVRAWPPLVALASLASLLAATGCAKSARTLQREYAMTLRPSELAVAAPEGPAARAPLEVIRVRAWVDADFQAQTPRWRERVAEQVRRASVVTEGQFGRRFELIETRAWPRPPHGEALDDALQQLRATDPGRAAELILGFVSATRLPTGVTEQLGAAALGGKHVVLRAMPISHEYDAIASALDQLSEREREDLAHERRVHREVALLLHEWAHTLGAGHEASPRSLMAERYEPRIAGFSPEAARLIVTALAERSRQPLADASEPAPAPTPQAPPASPSPPPVPVRKPDLTPRPELFVEPARATPARPSPARREADLASLARREEELSRQGADPAAWLELAMAFDRQGAPAAAERAAARAGTAPNAAVVMADARRVRRTVALPLEGVPAGREPDYVRLVEEVARLADEGSLRAAREAQARLSAAFPATPGVALGGCEVAVLERDTARGQQACTEAVRAFSEAPRAHLLLGRLAARARRWAPARDSFRAALELDDATGDPWAWLAAAYARLGDSEALRDLEARYLGRFGWKLQPATEPVSSR